MTDGGGVPPVPPGPNHESQPPNNVSRYGLLGLSELANYYKNEQLRGLGRELRKYYIDLFLEHPRPVSLQISYKFGKGRSV